MNDNRKTEVQLIQELEDLRRRIAEFESSEIEWKRTEEALRVSDERFKAQYRGNPIATFTWQKKEENFELIDFNDAAKAITDGRVIEFLGKNASDLYANRQDILRDLQRCFVEREIIKRVTQSEHFVPGRLIAITIGFVPPDLVMVHLEDITERKQDEEAYRNIEAHYRTLFEESPNGILLVDPETGKTIRSNKAAHMQLGYTQEEFAALRISDYEVLETPEETAKHVQKVIQDGIDDFETQHRTKSGEIRNVHVWAKAVQLSDHSRIYTIFQDITERKQLEARINQTLESLRKAISTTIQVVASTVEVRDPYTAGHQMRSADLARTIATEMGLSPEKIEGIRIAGSIHDIGKIAIPAEILSKPTMLSKIEFSLIKEHSRHGYEILKNVESPWPLAEIVYQHHERINGSGYPRGLKGKEILPEVRILAVADVVEAIASHRPYRPALGIDAALEEIEKNKGILYDAEAVDVCLRLFKEKRYHFN